MGDAATEILGLGQVAVPVQDVARARDFYRDVVGLRFLFEAPPKMAFFDCGGVRLMLAEPEGGESGGASILYFRVEDIEASHAGLVDRGAESVRAPERVADLGDRVLWLAFFRDSEGHTMALMSEVAKT